MKSNFKTILLYFLMFEFECFSFKFPFDTCYQGEENPSQHPYVVLLELQQISDLASTFVKRDHLCTASALSPTWALTAAHCLTSVYELSAGLPYNVEKLVINYGSPSSMLHNSTFSKVLFTVTHPSYRLTAENIGHNSPEQNDIALLRTTPMKISKFIGLSVVGLYLLDYEAVLAGFKLEDKTEDDIQMYDMLGDGAVSNRSFQTVEVMISECKEKRQWSPSFCLTSKCSQKVSVCGGDSGAPIMHSSGIIGILSVGDAIGDCLDSVEETHLEMAEVVVPISSYYSWIQSFITE